MEIFKQDLAEKRLCKYCQKPLDSDEHGNRKAHPECSYKNKLQHQKKKYKIGNNAKLMIQKNEAVAARLYEMDKQKNGIPPLYASEMGFKFNCPSTTHMSNGNKVYFFEHYGYSIENINGKTLIFIYNESDII